MLVEAISLLLAELNQYIQAADGAVAGSGDVAISGNISQVEHPDIGTSLENQLVLTVANFEEESTLKNGRTAFRLGHTIEHRHRPVHLNLLLLFTANYTNYATSLRRLDQVITFFQSHRHFDVSTSSGLVPSLSPETELSLTLDLVSLSLEEINHLWGALGGKELPFVPYRCRLVVIEEDRTVAGGGEIREIETDAHDIHAAAGSG